MNNILNNFNQFSINRTKTGNYCQTGMMMIIIIIMFGNTYKILH